jgi:hypothetical protein
MFTPGRMQYLNRGMNVLIALVWFINGMYCKLLNLVPRHQEIVARILGDEHAAVLTRTIGSLEIGMALWVISNFKPSLCAFMQISLIAIMNTLEFFVAPDLLLFGKTNAFLATLLIGIIILNEYSGRRYPNKTAS